MLRFASAPPWFYSYGAAFDIISAVVTLLIAVYGLKLYKFSGEQRHKYFSLSFFMITISLVFKSFSNFVQSPEAIVGQIVWPITLPGLTSQPMPFMAAYLGYRLFMLVGLLGIYSIVYKIKGKGMWIALYLILVVTLFSTSTYLLFYTTAFLFLITITRYYYKNYVRLRTIQSCMVFAAFVLITAGQLLFLAISYKLYSYVIGEVLQLFGYLLLLFSYLGLVVKNGKTNKT